MVPHDAHIENLTTPNHPPPALPPPPPEVLFEETEILAEVTTTRDEI